ncbi:hypothetical protein HDU87_005240 [Geranomyces variabilis]|uniref:SANT domain-containing protein n=1 Tax=Geranomyces variabilis TaxID=109894 RepID=A0AAD5THD0_9FUNG|nr:hypothetical protein HDU87_005240 [Geranomyces variabilis]
MEPSPPALTRSQRESRRQQLKRQQCPELVRAREREAKRRQRERKKAACGPEPPDPNETKIAQLEAQLAAIHLENKELKSGLEQLAAVHVQNHELKTELRLQLSPAATEQRYWDLRAAKLPDIVGTLPDMSDDCHCATVADAAAEYEADRAARYARWTDVERARFAKAVKRSGGLLADHIYTLFPEKTRKDVVFLYYARHGYVGPQYSASFSAVHRLRPPG